MKIRFTPSARAQLLSAVAYIRRDNPEASRRFRRRAEEVLRRLEEFPESGRVVPDWIVAVWHGAQLPQKPEA